MLVDMPSHCAWASTLGTFSPFAASFNLNTRPANLSLPQIFAATSARMVPDPSKAFAICPHGLPEERQVQLEKTCEDFRVPPASQRVTLYWLQVRWGEREGGQEVERKLQGVLLTVQVKYHRLGGVRRWAGYRRVDRVKLNGKALLYKPQAECVGMGGVRALIVSPL